MVSMVLVGWWLAVGGWWIIPPRLRVTTLCTLLYLAYTVPTSMYRVNTERHTNTMQSTHMHMHNAIRSSITYIIAYDMI